MSSNMLGEVTIREVAGAKADLDEKLGSANGREWLTAFKRFLRKENPWEMAKQEFKTWKVIKLGTHKSVGLLREALEAAKFRIGDWAADILPKTVISEVEIEVELVRVTVAELGFEKGATRKEIYDRALELGLGLCPAEVGPQLRLQYADQPKGEYLLVAMEPAAYSGGDLRVFNVSHVDGDRWLTSDDGHADSRWDAGNVWLFVRCK